ncbi:ImpA family type VI secretion system protein [Jiella mangrovi]|uniref:Type VI secretion system ImpA family N-terminal domain-containing protein n=1 Tax=Jiella mangrovi TaxID=2821407 RepID=A0ABS4BGQ9_9HYPH|nr:type VI secretion system ImpA family N-terminal domain-containing protein [Jiella mangrovi]MBP0615939.1 type VI secretion system ImpA family N-terminal domain-containing protein [Jiella mangrovi]
MVDQAALLEPLFDDEPCGPDLVAAGDPDFLTFRDRIEALLPTSFPGGLLTRDDGRAFEPREIKLRDGREAIAALLSRSRDLRFVLLEARLLLLTGNIGGFAGAIELSAKLLEARWNDVHPRAPSQRRAEYEAFDPPAFGPIPLQFVPLVTDRRAGVIRFRDFLIAIGEARARADETTLDETRIRAVLADAQNLKAVEALRGYVTTIKDSLEAIKATFVANGEAGEAPQMKAFLGTVARIAALLDEASGKTPDASEDAASVAAGAVSSSPQPPPGLSALATIPIGHHGEARLALIGAEHYFAGSEPSSPALLLVHQARMLLGRPLIEALQILAPQLIGSATLTIDGPPGLALDLERLQALNDSAISAADMTASATATPAAPADPRFVAKNRDGAASLIASVEAYVRLAEPSSPVPILLARARGLIGSDFLALMPHLFPSSFPKGE